MHLRHLHGPPGSPDGCTPGLKGSALRALPFQIAYVPHAAMRAGMHPGVRCGDRMHAGADTPVDTLQIEL